MRLRRSFGILEGDLAPLARLGVLHFLVAASLVLSQIGATSLLVATLGAEALPQAYVSRATLLICAGLFVIPLIDRWDRLRTFTTTLVVFALILGLARVSGTGAPEYGYRALYPLVFFMKSLVYLQFWLIAAEICEIRQAKRIFPILLGLSLAGGLLAAIGASLLPFLSGWLQTQDLLLVAAALLVAALVPTRLVKSHYHQYLRQPLMDAPLRSRSTWMQVRSDLAMTLDSPLLRTLSAAALLFSVLTPVLDYLMGRAVTARFVDASGAVDLQLVASFYAVLDGTTIGAGALVLLLLSKRLIAAVGVTRGHLAASSTFLVGFAAIGATLLVTGGLGTAFFIAVLASRVVQKVLRVSLYRSSIDLICNPVPAEHRGRARAFREVVIEPGGVLLGGMFLMAAGFVDMRVMLTCALLLSGALVALSARLKGLYLENLVQVLREKSRVRFTSPASTPRQKRRRVLSWSDGFDLERALDVDDAPSRAARDRAGGGVARASGGRAPNAEISAGAGSPESGRPSQARWASCSRGARIRSASSSTRWPTRTPGCGPPRSRHSVSCESPTLLACSPRSRRIASRASAPTPPGPTGGSSPIEEPRSPRRSSPTCTTRRTSRVSWPLSTAWVRSPTTERSST